jgi:hypothetical protein
MEATVRGLYTEKAIVDGHTYATGNKPTLCFRGSARGLGIINDGEGIITIPITLEDLDKAPLIMYGPEEYPVAKFISHIERIMQNKPISDEALELIREWPNTPEDFDLPSSKVKRVATIKRAAQKSKSTIISIIAGEMELPPGKIRKFHLSCDYGDDS